MLRKAEEICLIKTLHAATVAIFIGNMWTHVTSCSICLFNEMATFFSRSVHKPDRLISATKSDTDDQIFNIRSHKL